MTLEYKKLDIDIKAIDEKGSFQGLLSPYNNVDYGNDKVMPSIKKRNDGKKVPYLWQHDPHNPIGELHLKHTKEGIAVDGQLYLDKDDNGQYLIPKAAEAYVLMKRGALKLSIGYKTLDYKYVTEGNQQIRELHDIDIMEGSAVTFPMNSKAKITSVKEEGGDNVEEKAMSFNEILKLRESNEMRWQLQDALNQSTRQLIEDQNMAVDDKIKQLNQNVDEFAAAYKETMGTIIKASAKKNKKEFLDMLESKSSDTDDEKDMKEVLSNFKTYIGLETKDKKELTNNIKEEIKCLTEQLEGLISDDESQKHQEKENDDNIELKDDEIDAIKSLYENIKGVNK